MICVKMCMCGDYHTLAENQMGLLVVRVVAVIYLFPWEVFEGCKGYGDRWVEMGTRDMAS